MNKIALSSALFAAALLAGCNDYKDQVVSPKSARPDAASTSAASPGEGSIAPMTTTPIPNAPISGAESVGGGGGGGVGQAAKDRARGVTGSSSLDQLGDQ